jgi:hypothetical protein
MNRFHPLLFKVLHQTSFLSKRRKPQYLSVKINQLLSLLSQALSVLTQTD